MKKVEVHHEIGGTVQRTVFYAHGVDNHVRPGTPPYWTLIKLFDKKGRVKRVFRCASYTIEITDKKRKTMNDNG